MRKTTTPFSILAVMLAAAGARGQPARPAPEKPDLPAVPEPRPDALPATSALSEKLSALLRRPGGLTAEQAARRAASESYDARARQHQADQASAEIDRARVGYYPRLTLTARYVRLSAIDQPLLGNVVVAPTAPAGPIAPGTPLVNAPLEFPTVLNQYTLQANVTVPVSDYLLRTSQSVAAASRSREAAALQARAAELGAAADAKIAYYSWARARLQAVVAEQTVEQARSQREAARAVLDAGRGSRADALRAESQLARAELFVARAKNVSALAEENLRVALHDPPERRYEIGEDLLAGVASETPARNLPALYAEAMNRRLEIRALDRTEWSLREQRRVARAGSYPRLDAFGNAYYANPNQRFFPQREDWKASWDVGVQLTWTPNELGVSSALAAGLEARRAEVEAQKAGLRDALRLEVTQAYHALREADAAIAASDRGLIAAEEAYRVRRELYDFGRASTVELIDADTELLRARLAMIDAKIDQLVARARLDHAVGRSSRKAP